MADKIAPNSSGSQPGSGLGSLALRFISGKYQGGEFPLEDERDIFIGRSSDLEMVLVEEMVSRKHARISMHGGQIVIEDLGSTNGTFVNGEKIDRASLKEGDRVLIGTSILKVVATSGSQAAMRVPAPTMATAQRNRTMAGEVDGPSMSGRIEEVPLPDLLQLFGTSRKSGVLVIRTESSTGQIFLRQGILHYALIDTSPDLSPLKAIYRMLTWQRGMFQLDPPDSRTFESAMDLQVQEVLMEAFRQQDEFAQLRSRLPDLEVPLMLSVPLEPLLRDLEANHLDVLQIALNSPDVGAVMDHSTLNDLETGEILLDLLERGYLTAAD